MTIDPRAASDVGGALRAWRLSRRCRACGAHIVRGAYEVCPNQHTLELAPSDLRRPLDADQRRQVEAGYWERWLLSTAALLMLVLGGAVLLLAVNGLVVATAAWIVAPLALLLALVGLLLGPPVLHLPTRERLHRQVRAAEPPADW